MKSIFTLLLCLGFCWMSYKQSSQTKDAEYNTEEDTHKAISLSSRELDLALQWCDKIWLMNEQGQIVVGIPKDLVLNGIFSKIFGNESFFFDMDTASFKRKQNTQRNIFLKGHRTAYRWTKRALERKGYNISLGKDSHILSIEKNEKEALNKQCGMNLQRKTSTVYQEKHNQITTKRLCEILRKSFSEETISFSIFNQMAHKVATDTKSVGFIISLLHLIDQHRWGMLSLNGLKGTSSDMLYCMKQKHRFPNLDLKNEVPFPFQQILKQLVQKLLSTIYLMKSILRKFENNLSGRNSLGKTSYCF